MKIEKEFFLKLMLSNGKQIRRLTRDSQSRLTDGLLQFCKERHCSIDNVNYSEFYQWLSNHTK